MAKKMDEGASETLPSGLTRPHPLGLNGIPGLGLPGHHSEVPPGTGAQ